MVRRRTRGRSRALAAVVCVIAGLAVGVAPSGSQQAGSHPSLRDRVVESAPEFDEFKAAAAVPAVSPALAEAESGDTVVRYDDAMVEPASMVAVVRRPVPRSRPVVYRVPSLPAGADAWGFLQRHLERAADRDASTVLFPRDAVFEIEGSAPLRLRGVSDVVVDLNGSTLRLTEQSVALRIDDGERLVVRNGRIEGAGLLASVAEVSIDGSGRPVFAVLPGFREALESSGDGSPALFTVGSAVRGRDGGWELDPERYTEIFTNRGGSANNFRYEAGSFVPTSRVSRDMRFRDGDLVWLLHENNTAPAVLLDNEDGLEDVTLEDLTLVNIPGMGIIGEVRRGLHIDGLRMERADDPLAIFATSSDGVHINANGGDVVVENSYFGPNADDKVTIKGNYWRVADIDRGSNTIVVEPAGRDTSVRRWGLDGQRLVFVDGGFGLVATATLAADSDEDDDRHRLELDRVPAEVEVGSLVANVDNGGGRVVIRDNVFVSTRAQGVLVQTQHVVVERNVFDAIAGPAIRLNMGLAGWFEGVNTDNVVIAGNVIGRSGDTVGESGDLIELRQLDASREPVAVIGNVRIVDNVVSDAWDDEASLGAEVCLASWLPGPEGGVGRCEW